ncbi:MAG: hypothetical protein IKU94_00680 [Bacteroidaceae bacterium]|nr:hypothetical protein [Bacteroidaceae bacterium]MBR4930448.1 hypothetical protein [Bacteroidaceae bacterium]
MADYNSKYSGTEIDEAIGLALDGTVKKTGDKMSGDLAISKSSVPAVDLENTTTGRTLRINAGNDNTAGIYNRKDASNITGLYLRAAKETPNDAVAIQHTYNGTSKYYNLYGQHNKPTPADIGAVAKDGSVPMTGNLSISKSTYPQAVMANTTTGRSAYVQAADDSTVILMNRKDGSNRTSLTLHPESVSASDFLSLYVSKSGAVNRYSVLHTGNMDALISSLRIATGTYSGSGDYGGSVTLTCGFKPAFAIIYRSDTEISATTVPINTNVSGATTVAGDWSGDFAILVPTSNGVRVYSNNTVTVESGDTYLKFTPSGLALNGGGATYNYIIVGS